MTHHFYALPEFTGISSLDEGYESGDLSVFYSRDPDTNDYPANIIDSKKNLYDVRNNAETTLKQALAYAGRTIIVEDASLFPPQGLIRIGGEPGVKTTGYLNQNGEIIYYASRTDGAFRDLTRGFAGTRRDHWDAGNWASNAVMAEHHNAVKDATLTIEEVAGVTTDTSSDSLLGKIIQLETKHLTPSSSFRAYPIAGSPPLIVNFHSFSNYDVIRFLWDFGDGTTSIERNPTHTYNAEGFYSVQLHVVTPTGAQWIATKKNYIKVEDKAGVSFFYAEPVVTPIVAPAEFLFVDQTDGDIVQRYWVFDDGSPSELVLDPNEHTVTHTYTESNPDGYEPSLLIAYGDQKIKRIFTEKIIVP